MLNALRACEEHPTILLQLEDMREDLVRFTYKLYALLGQADAFFLQIPPRNILHEEFEAALKPKHREEKAQPTVTLSKSQVQTIVIDMLNVFCMSCIDLQDEHGLSSVVIAGDAVPSSLDGVQLSKHGSIR